MKQFTSQIAKTVSSANARENPAPEVVKLVKSLAWGCIPLIGLVTGGSANAALLGPTPYLSFADSPFAGGSFSYFQLETFEDGLLNTPGVSVTAVGVDRNIRVLPGGGFTDSVDGDDGSIDGSGTRGSSLVSGGVAGVNGFRFTFDAATLGSLPTSAGIVWTDGDGAATFQAFGPGNVLLGTLSANTAEDRRFEGRTAEDRFYGIEGLGPIASITIQNASGSNEVDHLQYGLASTSTAVPEPFTIIGTLIGGTAALRMRKQLKGASKNNQA
jgi:hypothetical protein